jgi:hypothetical protein
VQVGVPIITSTREKRVETKKKSDIHCEKSAMSWSLLTLSGRFCKNRILFGGKYSSGIWTAGRLGADTAGPSAMGSKMMSIKKFAMRKSGAHSLRPDVEHGTSVLGGWCSG